MQALVQKGWVHDHSPDGRSRTSEPTRHQDCRTHSHRGRTHCRVHDNGHGVLGRDSSAGLRHAPMILHVGTLGLTCEE
jgi:hypothetical protein